MTKPKNLKTLRTRKQKNKKAKAQIGKTKKNPTPGSVPGDQPSTKNPVYNDQAPFSY